MSTTDFITRRAALVQYLEDQFESLGSIDIHYDEEITLLNLAEGIILEVFGDVHE